ncbi:MAG TPA: phosphate signaling complex protein PhoU [Acidimicrobiia bacterium]|nr:phosphate signaling complex protein PhoU [Acidimicrobiia bacterium]
MTSGDETRKVFAEELQDLRADVIRLAALVTEAIAAGTQALLDADLSAAEHVVEQDAGIDELAYAIEDHCFILLARQQPMASDLRTVLAVLRIGHELERSGDLMKSVVKATRQLYPHSIDPKLRGIISRMGEQAANETRLAIDAFADNDPSRAAALFDMDDVMDDLTKSLFRYIMNREGLVDEGRLLESIQLALVGRHYERIADHAVNVADRVVFIATGLHGAGDSEEFSPGADT